MPTKKIPENVAPQAEVDIAAEFAELAKKLRATVELAWGSQERQNIQREVEDGLVKLRDELDRAITNLRETESGQKVETEVKRVRDDIESGKIGDDMRKGVVVGLRGISTALDKVAEGFTPLEDTSKAAAPKK
jgi:hypothetical protein